MEAFSLTANNNIGPEAVWTSIPLEQLDLPKASEGTLDKDFWPSRHEEYNRLEWDAMDWHAVRDQLGKVADRLERQPDSNPELEFTVPTMRERTFLEMWFGYGDPSVEARSTDHDRYHVAFGQHRICAYADYPMSEHDRDVMRIPESGFLPSGPLSPNTRIPMLVH